MRITPFLKSEIIFSLFGSQALNWVDKNMNIFSSLFSSQYVCRCDRRGPSVQVADGAGHSATARAQAIATPTTATPAPAYSQAMGATDSNGFVVSFPFSASATNSATIPVQLWCDAVNGNDSYNGLSPYPGYQMNGTGTNYQFGATGKGKANAAYGPKKTFFAAYSLIKGNASNRVGNQIFLAQGQSFYEGASTDSLIYRSGFSVQFPFCIQSYDPRRSVEPGKAWTRDRDQPPDSGDDSQGRSRPELRDYQFLSRPTIPSRPAPHLFRAATSPFEASTSTPARPTVVR